MSGSVGFTEPALQNLLHWLARCCAGAMVAMQSRLHKRTIGYVNDTPVHFALRRTQIRFTAARTWIILVIVGVLAGLVGPFGTYQSMPVAGRIAYWLASSAGCYFVGFVGAVLVLDWLKPSSAPARIVLAGLAAGIPVTLLAYGLNVLVYGGPTIDILTLGCYCLLISTAFVLIRQVIVPNAPAAAVVQQAVVPAEPALLARLPHAIRGRLLHLAVSDHYVDVTTSKGHELVLIRLSDAMTETAPVPGLQVHRSHWVALDAVKRSSRQAGKPVLELENGTIVPVSRTFLDAARAAGILAR